MAKVPKCKDCEHCKSITSIYLSFYCDDVDGEYMWLSVDYPPKTSPVWCPKREKVGK